MKNNVKKFMALGLALGLCLSGVMASASTAVPTTAKAPSYSGGIRFENPSFIGIKVARINASATPTVLVTGQGLLYAICPTGGTIGKYAVAYNYLAATSGNGNPSATYIDPAASGIGQYLISPQVHYLAGVPGANSTTCWVPPYPVRFEDALMGYTNDTANNVLFFYRLDSGTNP